LQHFDYSTLVSSFAVNYYVRIFWNCTSLHCLQATGYSCELYDRVFGMEWKRLDIRAVRLPAGLLTTKL